MSPLIHLDDDVTEERSRVLKPVRHDESEPGDQRSRPSGQKGSTHARPFEDEILRPMKPYAGEPAEDAAILQAFNRVEAAIVKGEPADVVEALQRDLQAARDAVAETERLELERNLIGRDVAKRRANDETLKKARAGANAAAKARRADAFVLVASYNGIVIRAFPARADDPVIRQTVERSFANATGWFAHLAEREIAAERLRAMGNPGVQLWKTPAIVARLRDDLRVGLAHNCISISVGRDA